MKRLNLVLGTTVFVLLFVLCQSSAKAQATRTWVSGVGDDVNPCSRTAPCKTFAGAISKTAAGGEISVTDPGGYGNLTITKSITINADAALASVLNSNTNGIVVNAGASDVVTIRGLSINGAGTGLSGIRYLAGKQLNVENCKIQGFTQNGIDVALTNTGAINVQNTTITGVTGAVGINVATTSGTVAAFFNKVNLQGSTSGLSVGAGGIATISDSTITQNATSGVRGLGGAIVNINDCVITQNGIGVAARTGSTVRLSDVNIFDNTFGLGAGGGIIASYRNNKITGNTTDGAPTLYLDGNQ